MIGNNLGQFSGTGLDCGSQVFEIVQLVPHFGSDADPMPVGVAEAFLEEAEESSAAGNPNGHAPQLTKHLVPEIDGDSGAAAEGLKNLLESFYSVWGELKGLGHCVEDPAEHHFPGR